MLFNVLPTSWEWILISKLFLHVGEGVGRGIVLMAPSAPRQPFQQFAFDFDQMFSPKSTQCEVFEEVSQLVQSALDGYKVG